jgi:DNA-binding NtrC family response regulator
VQDEFVKILDRGFFTPIGSTEPVPATFRLITASQRSLEEMVANNSFREELFYKINAFPIRIPALRERLDDVVVLAREVLRRYCRQIDLPEDCMFFSEGALQRLLTYPWPGNIKELENAVVRAAILSKGAQITEAELAFLSNSDTADGGFRSLRDIEEEHIRRVLHHFRGNIRKAAQVLGISRGTLYERIQRYDIDLINRRK